jgi:UDPglucose 6-dehydrogenase
MKISVVGTGYVGLVTGVAFAHYGHDVLCVDNNQEKLQKLRKGISPIYEPGIEDLLLRGMASGRLRFTDSVEEATRSSDVVFIAVGTPPAEDGTPDLTAVRAVAKAIAHGISQFTVVVNKSTVPVGTGDVVAELIAAEGVPRSRFEVVSNPEFLREGSAIKDTLYPERVVIGAACPAAAQKVADLYSEMTCPIVVTDVRSAELIKYASNAFLAMKISYINALSEICEACGADVGEISRGMGLDSRIGKQFLRAGLGWGGSCFPKDVKGLITIAESYGIDFKLMRTVEEINDAQCVRFAKRIEQRLGGFSGKTLGILGLAFKPNTDDMRDARSLILIDYALEHGANVRAFDPIAMPNCREMGLDVEFVETPHEVAYGADALVLVTEWDVFKTLDLSHLAAAMKDPVLFDARRAYSPAAAIAAGFDYFTIGSLDQNRLPIEAEVDVVRAQQNGAMTV